MTNATYTSENGQVKTTPYFSDYGTTTLPGIKLTAFHMKGFEDATQFGGHPDALRINLNKIREETLLETTLPNKRQKDRISKLESEINCLIEHNRQLEDEISRIQFKQIPMLKKNMEEVIAEKERLLEENRQRINELKKEKIEIKQGEGTPSGGYMMLGDRLGFYLGFTIEAFLTLFLILFYASVVFSAFMLDVNKSILEEINNGRLFSSTIINLEAFAQSFGEAGISGPVFLLASTFMFLGLGYLIYQFGKTKAYGKMVALYTFTFLFDALLAYEIVRKIHVANVNGGMVSEAWRYDLAFYDFSFWAILCAGFAMYIIWGIILCVIIQEFNKLKPFINTLNENAAKIKACEKDAENIRVKAQNKLIAKQEAIDKLVQKIEEMTASIQDDNRIKLELHQQIAAICSTREVDMHLIFGKANAYTLGWIHSLSCELESQEYEHMTMACSEQLKDFLADCHTFEHKSIHSN